MARLIEENSGGRKPPGGRSPEAVLRWVVASVHQHREGVAQENLQRQNITHYCPMVRKEIRHARRRQSVLRPLFPGYIFVGLDGCMSELRVLNSTYGVRSVIQCGDAPGFIDGGIIEALRAREVEGVIVRPDSPYRVGQRVSMAGGPFDGLVATIIDMRENERLVVLLNLMNQSVKVKIAAEHVRPV